MGTLCQSRGDRITPGIIPGQGCLAQMNLYEDANWDAPLAPGYAYEFYYRFYAETPDVIGQPVGITLEHMIELYWRWKNWRLVMECYDYQGTKYDCDLVCTPTIGNAHSAFPYTSPLNGQEPANESELCLPLSCLTTSSDSGLPGFVSATTSAGASGNHWWLFVDSFNNWTQPAMIAYNSGLYWPNMEPSMGGPPNVYYEAANPSDPDEWGAADIRAGTHGDGSVYAYNATGGKLTMSDGTVYYFPVSYNKNATASGHIHITCDEYWEHANVDGTPKYNTSTGLKL